MNVERGVNSAGGAHGVNEADAVERLALELAGEVDAMPLWSHMAATFGAAGVTRGLRPLVMRVSAPSGCRR